MIVGRISWFVNDKKEAESEIIPILKNKNLYLAIVFFNEEAEIEFL